MNESKGGVCPDTRSAIIEKLDRVNGKSILTQKLSDIRFIVFDTETTGFFPAKGDEIISIAGVVVENGQIVEGMSFDRLVNPGRHIPDVVRNLTGIDDEMVKDKPSIVEVLNDFLAFAGDGVLVAHHAKFDLAFLNQKIKSFSDRKVPHHVLDTALIAQALHLTKRMVTLDELLDFYGIEPMGRHTAYGDAFATAKLFLRFIEAVNKNYIFTLSDLNHYVNRNICPHNPAF